MASQSERGNHFAGGLGLLAAATILCVKGLRRVEKRLRKRSKQNRAR